MGGNKLRNGILVMLLALVAYMVYDATMQPRPQDLEGDFTEVAFYRNENNTGPVQRVYAVTVADTLWEQMEAYGNFMPHTKYGNTKVYYFLQGTPVPREVFAGKKNFNPQSEPYCLAQYEKDAMGNVSLRKTLP
jgi:hypothetical protein